MGDEPRFPAPDEARRRSEAPFRPAVEPSSRTEPKPTIVTRAEAPPDDPPRAPGAPANKLTPDEVRALLAVEGASRPTAGGMAWRRGRLLVVPTGLVGLGLHLALGSAGDWTSFALTLVAIGWSARPLFRRDGW